MKRARRNTPQRSRRQTRSRGLLIVLLRRPALALVVLLLGLGAVALERMNMLPEPAAVAVRQVEQWLAPVLEEIGIDIPGSGAPGSPAPTEPRTADDQAAVGQSLALLDRITVEPERPRGYEREAWPHWLDEDGDCVNARHAVLASESVGAVTWDREGCDVERGEWHDAYTGEVWRDPRDLDVDHMVPLAEAYRSGGYAWSRERRSAFANELGDSRTLIAVSASANRAKGDQGPEDWLPPLAAYRCRYVADWVAVKVRWSLSMDERERVTVGNILRDCARE